MAQRAKPISPHLQIYRFTLTMLMSISQRATGIAQMPQVEWGQNAWLSDTTLIIDFLERPTNMGISKEVKVSSCCNSS